MDYQREQIFRTARNTLEGKQFFKSEAGARSYKRKADKRAFLPPYRYLLIVEVNEDCLQQIPYEEQPLDDYEAITIHEADLPRFTDCVRFVDRHDV